MSDQNSNAGDVVTPAPEPEGVLALAVGLACFGFAIGFTTAISKHEGISGQLLSGLFSFVGGSILTYGGFRYTRTRRGEGPASVALSPRRVGLSLIGFSLGVGGGQHGGLEYSSWEGIRIAQKQSDACVKRAMVRPDASYQDELIASCFRVTPSAGGMIAANGTIASVGNPPEVLAGTHRPHDVPPNVGTREKCWRNKKDLNDGGTWEREHSATADALRDLVNALNCDRL